MEQHLEVSLLSRQIFKNNGNATISREISFTEPETQTYEINNSQSTSKIWKGFLPCGRTLERGLLSAPL